MQIWLPYSDLVVVLVGRVAQHDKVDEVCVRHYKAKACDSFESVENIQFVCHSSYSFVEQ